MNVWRALAKALFESIHAPAARTATGSTAGVDISAYEGLGLLILDSAAGTGTTPTLDVKLQECATSGGTYTDVPSAAFTQVTTAASKQQMVVDLNQRQKFLKVTYTIGGTTPSFTFAAELVGMKKNS